MAISFVAAGTTWTGGGVSGSSYTLNAPAGIANGDIMIALVTVFPSTGGSSITVNPPTGWTTVKGAYSNASGDNQIAVLTRTATASEPGSWGGTFSASSTERVAMVVAYRGAQSILTSGTSTAGGASSYSTATVNNTVTNSWRIVAAAYGSGSATYDISSNETSQRALDSDTASGGGATEGAIWDSNAVVGTGNTSRTVSRSAAWGVSCSWIGILQPTAGTAATGAWASTLANVTGDGAGNIHDDATLVCTLGNVTALSDGYGQPPLVSGTETHTLGNVSADMAGGTAVTAVLAMVVLPAINFQAETRAFGIRVITVDFDESRIITVPSRGADD